ncbi:phage shock protein operon transcriptional activator [Stagnimonas aquatica]|uniref:Phage shock protein operon transcriptional activator n=1 Tax=Stagnimonas aquatica TaxID=2689987 RepID=A0A3N0VAD9_9GAMM|nr:phage shock protein operon transcriptional activator [Stagnimonas aquatica]ROH89574.1 phage shock protein operon transcriptional activator [Stagnimonas aquatica]
MRDSELEEVAPPPLVGESECFLAVMEQASRAARLSKPVLVIGERGSGKELIASRLHYLSERWAKRLVKFNCAAVNDELLESELFGHVAGAFTGAVKARAGRFELAHGGTLFLDELASMSLRLQEKLLRVLEYGEFERVGSSETQRVDVRVVAAANVDLPAMAASGRFREDLLDRLSFEVITLPPLRERREDILLLAQKFGEGMARELGREYFAGFSPAAEQQLLDYSWPGNVRELKNAVERAVYRLDNARRVVERVAVDPFESPFRMSGAAPAGTVGSAAAALPPVAVAPVAGPLAPPPSVWKFPLDFKTQVADYEVRLLRAALAQAQFRQTRAAELLGLNYHQLRGLLRKYDLLKELRGE